MVNITEDAAACALRFIPLACGTAMVELSYRAAKMVFQNAAICRLSRLPWVGYCPSISTWHRPCRNEPMAAVIPGFLFLLSLRFIIHPGIVKSLPHLVVIGALLGISWITKISTLIWIIPLCAVMVRALILERASIRDWFRSTAAVGSACIATSGWFFARNFILVGKPFYTQAYLADARWWQDPGYRTPAMFFEFGHVLTGPIYSGMRSVWIQSIPPCGPTASPAASHHGTLV